MKRICKFLLRVLGYAAKNVVRGVVGSIAVVFLVVIALTAYVTAFLWVASTLSGIEIYYFSGPNIYLAFMSAVLVGLILEVYYLVRYIWYEDSIKPAIKRIWKETEPQPQPEADIRENKTPHEIITRSGNVNALKGRSLTINCFGAYKPEGTGAEQAAKRKWDENADEYNQWDSLSREEQEELTRKEKEDSG